MKWDLSLSLETERRNETDENDKQKKFLKYIWTNILRLIDGFFFSREDDTEDGQADQCTVSSYVGVVLDCCGEDEKLSIYRSIYVQTLAYGH